MSTGGLVQMTEGPIHTMSSWWNGGQRLRIQLSREMAVCSKGAQGSTVISLPQESIFVQHRLRDLDKWALPPALATEPFLRPLFTQ